MSRITLDIPAHLPFSTQLTIRVGDLNYADHLGNDAVLSMMQEARRRYLRNLGFDELDFGGGVGSIMTDVGLVYRSEGFYGETIEIQVGPADISSRGFDLYYRLLNAETGKPLAEAKTGILCFDYQSKKVARLPEPFLAALKGGDHG